MVPGGGSSEAACTRSTNRRGFASRRRTTASVFGTGFSTLPRRRNLTSLGFSGAAARICAKRQGMGEASHRVIGCGTTTGRAAALHLDSTYCCIQSMYHSRPVCTLRACSCRLTHDDGTFPQHDAPLSARVHSSAALQSRVATGSRLHSPSDRSAPAHVCDYGTCSSRASPPACCSLAAFRLEA
jgi:hypothetical protein